MEEKIKEIMSAVFQCPADRISDTTSADDLENWDSLSHMNLISALEEEFKIEFTDDEITELLNTKLIIHIVGGKVG